MSAFYSFSLDQDTYAGEFPTREAALAAAVQEVRIDADDDESVGHLRVYTALNCYPAVEGRIRVDEFLLQLEESLANEAPENTKGSVLPPLNIGQKHGLLHRLQSAYRDWAACHEIRPRWWHVDQVESLTVAEARQYLAAKQPSTQS